MVDMTDYYRSLQHDDVFKRYHKGILYWTTERGDKILVQNMSSLHIRNAIKDSKDSDFIKIFEMELKKRQDQR